MQARPEASRSLARRLGPGLALASGGLGAGLWLWIVGTPRARLPLGGGGVGFLHGRPTFALPVALAAGLGAALLAWIVLGMAWALALRIPLRATLPRTAVAFAPGALLALVVLGRALPLGPVTDPVAVLVDDGRVVLLATVGLAVVAASWPPSRRVAEPPRPAARHRWARPRRRVTGSALRRGHADGRRGGRAASSSASWRP